jgi:hypothetical protein
MTLPNQSASTVSRLPQTTAIGAVDEKKRHRNRKYRNPSKKLVAGSKCSFYEYSQHSKGDAFPNSNVQAKARKSHLQRSRSHLKERHHAARRARRHQACGRRAKNFVNLTRRYVCPLNVSFNAPFRILNKRGAVFGVLLKPQITDGQIEGVPVV